MTKEKVDRQKFRLMDSPRTAEARLGNGDAKKVNERSRLNEIQPSTAERFGNKTANLARQWRNGRRLYYSYIPKTKILLLLGGSKNGQQKDINRSKKIYKSYIKEKKRGHD